MTITAWLFIILLTIASAVLYRLGGMGQSGKDKYPKIPLWVFNTKMRDMGCAAAAVGGIFVLGVDVPWWIHALAFGTLFGMLTTYWDWLFKYDNYWFHGFTCGLAFAWYGWYAPELWLWLGVRALVMAVFMGTWCHVLFPNDVVQETGRGAIIPFTLPLLLFGGGLCG